MGIFNKTKDATKRDWTRQKMSAERALNWARRVWNWESRALTRQERL